MHVAVGLTFAEYAVLWHVSDTVVVDRETLASWVCDHVPSNVPDEVNLDACRSAIDSLVRRRLIVELTESAIEEDLARWRAESLPVSWGVDRDRRPGDVDLTEDGYRVFETLTRSPSKHAARPAQGYNDEAIGRIRVFGETEVACHEAVKHLVARIDKSPWRWPRDGIQVATVAGPLGHGGCPASGASPPVSKSSSSAWPQSAELAYPQASLGNCW